MNPTEGDIDKAEAQAREEETKPAKKKKEIVEDDI